MTQGRWTAGGGATGGPPGRRRRGWRSALAPYALLPLRVFLGVTFVYAGLDKLTDASFLSDSGPDSIGETMRFARPSAAFPDLVDLALKAPTGFGYAIACGELAVGLGTLFGLLARLAALGGALISLSLWLTVSWSTEPYYYGNDLAYLMAWLPLVLAGAPYLSVDAALARNHWRRGGGRWRRGGGGGGGRGRGRRGGRVFG
ncbi:DoxX family protein [Streptomyces buecherae]|uniref:DoxX family protein n=1 Tax=Streptomyces buecherae TaxID=2763006 RepID=UPI0037A2BA44